MADTRPILSWVSEAKKTLSDNRCLMVLSIGKVSNSGSGSDSGSDSGSVVPSYVQANLDSLGCLTAVGLDVVVQLGGEVERMVQS